MTIKPIPTTYSGITFRSRLEARWAVLFTALGIQWLYEPEGYVLSDGTCYLPDFYFPEVDLYAEVKGVMNDADQHKIDEFRKDAELIVLGEIPKPSNELDILFPVKDWWENTIDTRELEEYWVVDSPLLLKACERALNAKFEHGEKPSTKPICGTMRTMDCNLPYITPGSILETDFGLYVLVNNIEINDFIELDITYELVYADFNTYPLSLELMVDFLKNEVFVLTDNNFENFKIEILSHFKNDYSKIIYYPKYEDLDLGI